MPVFKIHTLDNPTSPRDGWGVFEDGRRVFGPANLYDCVRARNHIVSTLIHGEGKAKWSMNQT